MIVVGVVVAFVIFKRNARLVDFLFVLFVDSLTLVFRRTTSSNANGAGGATLTGNNDYQAPPPPAAIYNNNGGYSDAPTPTTMYVGEYAANDKATKMQSLY